MCLRLKGKRVVLPTTNTRRVGLCQPTGAVTDLCLAMRKPKLYIPPSWALMAEQEVYREMVDRTIDFRGKGKEW